MLITPCLVIHYRAFYTEPLEKLHDIFKPLYQKVAEVVSYPWCDEHWFLSDDFGHTYRFTFEPNGDGSYYIHIWDALGARLLHHSTLEPAEDGTASVAEVKQILKIISLYYREGTIACTDCGKRYSKYEGGHFFASSYCPDCWEGRTGHYEGSGGWKKKEAQESYD